LQAKRELLALQRPVAPAILIDLAGYLLRSQSSLGAAAALRGGSILLASELWDRFLRRFEMDTRVLGLTISAVILTYGAVGAIAQDRPTQQPDQQQMQSHPMGQEDPDTMGPGGMMGRGMMGRGMMGGHMTGRDMMGGGAMGPPIMFRMMFALMDADSDGTISLQEFQAAHERFFKAMDSNKDGKLTLEEIQAFMHGAR
jgi:hypothetical protein